MSYKQTYIKEEENMSLSDCLDELISLTDKPVDLSYKNPPMQPYICQQTDFQNHTLQRSYDVRTTPYTSPVNARIRQYAEPSTLAGDEHCTKNKYTEIFQQMSRSINYSRTTDSKMEETSRMPNSRPKVHHRQQYMQHIHNGREVAQNSQPRVRNGIEDLQNSFPHVRNGTADLHNSFPHVRNGTAALQKSFPHVRNGTADLHNSQPRVRNGTADLQNSQARVLNGTADFQSRHLDPHADEISRNNNNDIQYKQPKNEHNILKKMLSASIESDLAAWATYNPGDLFSEEPSLSNFSKKQPIPTMQCGNQSEILAKKDSPTVQHRTKRKYSEIDGTTSDNNDGYEVLGTLGVTNSKKRYFISMEEIERRISKPENMSENGLCCYLKRRRGSLPLGCPRPKPRQRGDITPFSSLCEAELGDFILAYKECLTRYIDKEQVIAGIDENSIPQMIQTLRKILLNIHLSCRPSSDFQRITHTFGAKMLESVISYLMSCLSQNTSHRHSDH